MRHETNLRLDEVAVGDEVAWSYGYDRSATLGVVERLTPTQIVVKSIYDTTWRFRRDTGRMVSSSHSYTYLQSPLDGDMVNAIARSALSTAYSQIDGRSRTKIGRPNDAAGVLGVLDELSGFLDAARLEIRRRLKAVDDLHDAKKGRGES